MDDKKQAYAKKLRHKYRLILYNDKTYAEVWQARLTPMNVIVVVGIVFLMLVTGTTSLIAFTSLREWIPGYPDSHTRQQIVSNALRLDSLQQQVKRWVIYNDNVSRILSGQEPIDIENQTPAVLEQHYNTIVLTRSRADSLFRLQVEGIDAAAADENNE
jgi:hypothetical protein